jgi:hypothetical protein
VRWRHKSGTGRRPFMGKQQRTGARRLEGMLTGMAKKRKWCKRREATVLTAGRRCSRRQLDENGGVAWTYAVAPGSLLCFGVPSRRGRPPPSAATCPAPPGIERSLAAAHLRRRDISPLLSLPPLLPLFPSSLTLWQRSLERGKTPIGLACERELDPEVVRLGQGAKG